MLNGTTARTRIRPRREPPPTTRKSWMMRASHQPTGRSRIGLPAAGPGTCIERTTSFSTRPISYEDILIKVLLDEMHEIVAINQLYASKFFGVHGRDRCKA